MVPGPPASSSGLGPVIRLRCDRISTRWRDAIRTAQYSVSRRSRDRTIAMLNVLDREIPFFTGRMRYTFEALADCIEDLFVSVNSMEAARNYLLRRAYQQEEQINNLHLEMEFLSLDFGTSCNKRTRGQLSLQAIRENSSNANEILNLTTRPSSVLRGDSSDDNDTALDLSGIDDLPVGPAEVCRNLDWNLDRTAKNEALLDLDTATRTANNNLASSHEEDNNRARRRSEADRPRGGLTRTSDHYDNTTMKMDKESGKDLPPQGIRIPSGRRMSPTVPGALASLSSVGSASPSTTGGKPKSATVETELDWEFRDPLDLTFVDCPAMLEEDLQTQREVAAVETVVTSEDLQTQREAAVVSSVETVATSTPRPIPADKKRKAKKSSPGAISHSDEELEAGSNVAKKELSVILRRVKHRPKEKKPQETVPKSEEELDSSTRMYTEEEQLETSYKANYKKDERKYSRKNKNKYDISTSDLDSDIEYTGTEYIDTTYKNKLRSRSGNSTQIITKEYREFPSAKKSSGSDINVDKKSKKKERTSRKFEIVSTSKDDDDSEYAPHELKIMGSTAIRAIGLDCIKFAQEERESIKIGLSGRVSGVIKRNIKRATDVINTLIYKAEAAGNPALLKIKNRELKEQMERMKSNEVLRIREMEELRAMYNNLKKEMDSLKDRVNDAEEETRKARECQRLYLRQLKKAKDGTAAETADMATNTKVINLPVRGVSVDPLEGTSADFPHR